MEAVEDTAHALSVGRVEFLGLELEVAAGALVPRRETELLARRAIALLEEAGLDVPHVVDVCCGAGNLACAISMAFPTARVWASDLTEPTVALTRRNVARLRLAERVTVTRGDLFEALEELSGRVDLVVANPPYISSSRLDERRDLLDHEPREAFDAGPYGLTIHQRLLREASAFVRPGGWLAFELGLGQHRQITALARRARTWSVPEFAVDEDGNPRVAVFRREADPAIERRES
jgi:HemK-like putative methylase